MEYLLEMADRLNLITQRIGYALWQLQELEGVSATLVVLLTQAQRGMGREAGEALLAMTQRKTFGTTVRAICKSKLVSEEIEQRLRTLLSERNWLVHKSRASSRSAVHHDESTVSLLARVDAIADEALAVMKHVGELVEGQVPKHMGMTTEQIDSAADVLLMQWHERD